mmetsp:Transcript_18174/g.48246  ORF Transcript_18174/g.48246 Transcript_18174/m.48246 type:complete len:236 (-) Transcript_18174:511-1218(-)
MTPSARRCVRRMSFLNARRTVFDGDQTRSKGGGGLEESRFESVSCSVERDACADKRCIVAFRASSCCTTDDSSRCTCRTSFTRSALDINACSCARVASNVEARAALSTYSPVTSLTLSVVSSTSLAEVRPPMDFRKSWSKEAYFSTGIRNVKRTFWPRRISPSRYPPLSCLLSTKPPAASTCDVAALATLSTSASVSILKVPVRTSIVFTEDASKGFVSTSSISPPNELPGAPRE